MSTPSGNSNSGSSSNAMEVDSVPKSLAESIAELLALIERNSGETSSIAVKLDDASLTPEARIELSERYVELETSTERLSVSVLRLQRVVSATNPVVPVVAPVAAPVVKQQSNVCPRNLPLFQWENAIFDHSASVCVDVSACLRKFEDVLLAHGLDLDADFLRLVPQLLSDSQRTWYEQFVVQYDVKVAPPTWADFKTAITSRYGRTVDEDRAACAVELVNIVMNNGESLVNFIDRFNDLRRRAVDQVSPSSVLIDKFLRALPRALREKVVVSKANMATVDKLNVDAVTNLAKKLYDDLYDGGMSSVPGSVPASSLPMGSSSSSSSGVASSSRSSSHNDLHHSTNKSRYAHAVPSAVSSTGSRNKKGKSRAHGMVGAFCEVHGRDKHNTEDCQVLSRGNAALLNASVTASSPVADGASSSVGGGSQDRAAGKRPWYPKGHCFKCGAPGFNSRHVCDPAALAAAEESRRFNGRFGMM
ncbi:hypothetical protein ABG067_007907, partial [Albugo candida]